MKRLFLLFSLVIAIASAATAQTVLWLDYCAGQYNSTQQQIPVAGDIEVAIRLNQDKLAGLGGNEVSQIAMAFPTTHPATMKLWIRAERDGENLREINVEKIVAKWNTYALDTPLPLTGTEKELWVGATFTQKYASNKYISMAGLTTEDGCYYRVLGDTPGEWQNKAIDNVGSFCIRMGVTGDNIPMHDISISRVSASALSYGTGETIPFTARIMNHGADEAVNPVVRCCINNEVVHEETINKTIAPSDYADVRINVPTTSVKTPGMYAFSFELLWADGQPDTKPANNTDAINVGLVEAHHNIALQNVTTSALLYQRGSDVTVTGTIVNNDYFQVQNPRIAYRINGGEEQKRAISCKLATGESKDFSFTISTKTVEEDGLATIDLELVWNDGSVDDYPEDNKAQLQVTLTSMAPNRRMVVEEATGTWCGWCVRGIVGMHEMNTKYPNQFIGIAVHASDAMANSDYAAWMSSTPNFSGYPSCVINRTSFAQNPSPSNLENAIKSMPKYSELDVAVEGVISESEFNVCAKVTPLVDIDGATYSVMFVVTEDGISDVQANYYAGGGNGVMGGYEKLGSSVKVDFEDVAHGIWPSAKGTGDGSLLLPSSLVAGETYPVELSIPASQVKYRELENCNVIALVLNTETGEIVNGAKFVERLVGIHSVLAEDAATPAEIFDLQGRRVAAPVNGVNIVGGKKLIW